MIAGEYKGGDIPKGMEVYEIPALEWLNLNVLDQCQKLCKQ